MMTFDVYKKIIKIELEKLTKAFQSDDDSQPAGSERLDNIFDADHQKRRLDSENPYDMFTSQAEMIRLRDAIDKMLEK